MFLLLCAYISIYLYVYLPTSHLSRQACIAYRCSEHLLTFLIIFIREKFLPLLKDGLFILVIYGTFLFGKLISHFPIVPFDHSLILDYITNKKVC